MDKFKHIIYTRFDSHSATVLDKDWLKYRIEIFKKYTLQSLLNQTNQNFVLWIRYCWDFYEEVQKLNEYLKTTGLKCFFSYFDSVNDRQIEELNEYVKDSDLVLETRIDSDDMYHSSVVDEIQKKEIKEYQILIYLDGYLYQESTKKLWYYEGASPFYTCVYPSNVYIDKDKKKEYYPFLPVIQNYPNLDLQVLSKNKFIVVVHEKNYTRYTFDWVKEKNLPSGSMLKAEREVETNPSDILKNFSSEYQSML
jgi:hypothetical protein